MTGSGTGVRRESADPVRAKDSPNGRVHIAVASGKGGTGKTTVCTNLAAVVGGSGRKVTYLDADVEAPNGHLFLDPVLDTEVPVTLPVPQVAEERCTACGKCGEICQYGAIVCLGQRTLVFTNLCHGCGGCSLVCPEEAIGEIEHPIGVVVQGQAGGIRFIGGRLNVGRPSAPPVIRAAQQSIPEEGVLLVDAPPGTSCAAVQAMEGADYVLLVTEPTPFGMHDLALSVQVVRVLGLPFGVVVNRADGVDPRVADYCDQEGIEVLMEIPDDRRVAEACSRGELVAETLPEYGIRFTALFDALQKRIPA